MSSMITECLACKKEVSKTARTCPHCGDRAPGSLPEPGVLVKLAAFVTIVLLIWYVF